MNFRFSRAQMKRICLAGLEITRSLLARMTLIDMIEWDADFESWADDGQIEPRKQGWRTWLMMAGRGYGKTRAGAEWIDRLARSRKDARIALVGASIDEARAIMVEGVSGIQAVASARSLRVRWEPSRGRLTWPNGSIAELFSGDSPDGLRGPEHDFAWCDELAKWRCAEEAWQNLQFGLRRGIRPRTLVTTTPRSIGLIGVIAADPWTVRTHGSTRDNVTLDKEFVAIMAATYGGTRIGRQEFDGEYIRDAEGALWTRELIDSRRVGAVVPAQAARAFDRIVVGVDPPAGVGERCDACGIVVVGATGNELCVLADDSIGGLSPEGWANRVATSAARWGTSRIVAEANNGGAMVGSVLAIADPGLRVRLVHARSGKAARAEPVAMRFERGEATFAGHFPALEGELCGLIAGGEYQGPGRSPDRADAMVWAMTVLGEAPRALPRVRML